MERRNTFQILVVNYRIVARLFKYSKSFRKSYIAALLINAFTMIRFSFLIGLSVQWVTDNAISGNWAQLRKAVAFAVIGYIINSVLYFFEGYLMQTRVEMIMAKVKNELMEKVMHLSAQYHDSTHSGDLQSRLTGDLAVASNAISFTLVDPVNFMALGIVNLTLIGLISWKMVLICLLLVAAVILFNTLFLKRIQHSSERIQAAIATATERYSDIINGMPVIKIFNLQRWIFARYDEESRKVLFWQSRLVKITAGQKTINDFIDSLCTFGVMGVGVLFLSRGEVSTGELLAVSRYVGGLVFAFTGFGWVLSEITKCLAGAKRVLEVLDLPVEEEGAGGVEPDLTAEPVLAFEKVSFLYEEGPRVLSEFSGCIHQGAKVALVGRSGSGKSTVLKLLLGLYPCREGRILLFGKDMTAYSLSGRRQLMAYVPQASYLFSGTVRENIACGRADASEEEILQAARAAYAHEFIMKLPDGYDTDVGERGAFLSGGERQRIAIARALLKNAPIVLLDEPTSSLDPESEAEVQEALEVLTKGRTVITVTHRLSTAQNADRIIVLEEGRTVEAGSHQELIRLNQRYASYFNSLYDFADEKAG